MRVKNLLINRRTNAVWEAVATIAIFALWGLIAITFLAITGCDEGMNMTRPVVMEPTEPVEPTTNGEVKEPETPVVDPDPEETVEEPDDEVSEEVPEDPVPPMEPETPAVDPEVPVEPEIPEEPEVPVDTTAPTVKAVKWYSDYDGTIPITDDVSYGDTIYIKVVFSEQIQHNDLSIVIGGDVVKRYSGRTGRADIYLSSGTYEYTYRCRIPYDTVGTIVLHIGSATADIAGNTLAGESEHDAPFMVAEAIPELTTEEKARAEFEPYGFSEETTERLVQMEIQREATFDRYLSGEISAAEKSEIIWQLKYSGYGISIEYAVTLRAIYVEERPEEAYLLRGTRFESIGIAYLIVKEANPDAEGEEFEELFRQAAQEGTITIEPSLWNTLE